MKFVFPILVLLTLLCVSCGPFNVDYVKPRACAKWEAQGFECVDYEGWSTSGPGFGRYGGGQVWHRLRKIPDNGITYSGSIVRWGDELHVYGPKAADAIRPNN
jgi:hypothetical protein